MHNIALIANENIEPLAKPNVKTDTYVYLCHLTLEQKKKKKKI